MIDVDFINVFYHENRADNFTAQLFRLYAKADVVNKCKLALVYPREAALHD